MELKRTHNVSAVIVALNNGEIRIYNDKNLINVIKNDVLLKLLS